MTLRTMLLAGLLLTSAFALVPVGSAQASACPAATAPGELAPGVAAAGSDAVADTNVAADCYYVLPIGGDAAGKQLRVVVSSTQNHDVFVKETVASAAPYACGSTATTATSDTCTAWWPLVSSSYSIRVKRSAATDAPFTLTAFLEGAPASGCAHGFAVQPLPLGASLEGSLLDVTGARCAYVLSGAPSDPAHPAADVVRSSLLPAVGNFDLLVRRGVPPSGPTSSLTLANQRDCASSLAGVALDECESVIDEGLPLYVMVRRTSGGGSYSLATALTGSSCGLGPGYHPLANGADTASSVRGLVGAKCHFAIPTSAVDDLLSVKLTTDAQPGLVSAHSLAVARDAPIAPGVAADCAGTASYINVGIILQTPYQCDRLLEDGAAHQWYLRVTRAAGGSATTPVLFTVNGLAQAIPTLLNGVAQLGHVDAGEVQYWKVLVPEHATTLLVATAGDPSGTACSLGSQVEPTVALACLLLPFPMLIGCGVAAGYGVDCSALTGSLYDTCMAQIGDEAACQQADDARNDVCARLDEIRAGACAAADPAALSVKLTEMDLVVRYRHGLPTTAVNDCRSSTPGVAERCLFSATAQDADDQVVEPVESEVATQAADLAARIAAKRAPLDAALADLAAAVADRRAGVEPKYEAVRALLADMTGQDPGALPGTPAAPSVGTPGLPAADALSATPLPGAGKYFIAVRGPSSALLNQGGDYAIVAAHDDVRLPSAGDVQGQVDQAQDALSGAAPPELGDAVAAAGQAIDAAQDAAGGLPADLPLPDGLPVTVAVPQEGDGGPGDLVADLVTRVGATVAKVLRLA